MVQADTLLAEELEMLRAQVFDAFNRLPSWRNHWRMASIILLDQLQIAGANLHFTLCQQCCLLYDVTGRSKAFGLRGAGQQ